MGKRYHKTSRNHGTAETITLFRLVGRTNAKELHQTAMMCVMEIMPVSNIYLCTKTLALN